jgi:hypothetical protein
MLKFWSNVSVFLPAHFARVPSVTQDAISHSLSKWLLGCTISPYTLGLFILLSASSVFYFF